MASSQLKQTQARTASSSKINTGSAHLVASNTHSFNQPLSRNKQHPQANQPNSFEQS